MIAVIARHRKGKPFTAKDAEDAKKLIPDDADYKAGDRT